MLFPDHSSSWQGPCTDEETIRSRTGVGYVRNIPLFFVLVFVFLKAEADRQLEKKKVFSSGQEEQLVSYELLRAQDHRTLSFKPQLLASSSPPSTRPALRNHGTPRRLS